MQIIKNAPLAPYTSLRVGGVAEQLVVCDTYDETEAALADNNPVTILGFGSNSLISDEGLPGTTVLWRGGALTFEDTLLIADAGLWWDDVVLAAIGKDLWGVELTSEIPSSVGGAVFGNIAAYGQQVSDTLAWVEVYDQQTKASKRIAASDLSFAYRESSLQSQPHLIILRAAFQLSKEPLHELRYESALENAAKNGWDIHSLNGARRSVVETRVQAGSIYHPDDPSAQRTAGSFFKNPVVAPKQASELAKYDETGKALERLLEQSRIHGGTPRRASASHVLLAAGFNRGQTWNKVKLHDQHVLKIETLEGATAQEVYDVAHEIINTAQQKLGIKLTPEVRFLGHFDQ